MQLGLIDGEHVAVREREKEKQDRGEKRPNFSQTLAPAVFRFVLQFHDTKFGIGAASFVGRHVG